MHGKKIPPAIAAGDKKHPADSMGAVSTLLR
jgi:hypothetical protein